MTERYEADPFPGMSEREMLEGLGREGLANHIIELGSRASHLESKMNIAAEVLEGTYGVTIEQVLQERSSPPGGERNNGQ